MSEPKDRPRPTAITDLLDISPAARTGTRRLSDTVYDTLRNRLLDGAYLPGDTLVLRDLAQDLGVSVTPVREALHRLMAEGALEDRERQSVRIPRLSLADIEEVWHLRSQLEGHATRNAARLIPLSAVEDLRPLVEAIDTAKDHRALDQAIQVLRRLHFAIYDAACMPRLSKIIADLWVVAMPTLRWLLETEEANAEARANRLLLIQALHDRNEEAAEACIAADLRSAHKRLLAAVSSPEALSQ